MRQFRNIGAAPHGAAGLQPAGKLRFEIQGSGAETRSFCFVDDLVAGVMVMRDKGEHLGIYHVGTGEEVTIAELARTIAAVIGYAGGFRYDLAKPDGTPRKLMDVAKLTALGWRAGTGLADGIRRTYDWYLENRAGKAA